MGSGSLALLLYLRPVSFEHGLVQFNELVLKPMALPLHGRFEILVISGPFVI